MNKRQMIWIAIIIVIGAILAGVILTSGKAPSPNASHEGHGKTSSANTHADHDEAEPSDHDHDHDHSEFKDTPAAGGNTGREPSKGPKGGKLFTQDGFGVEVLIFEQGVPPQLRLYLYENGKPLPPTAARATVTLSRLGAPAQIFNFKPESNYLLGDQVVEEPHSFDIAIAAERSGKTFRWGYHQVEARVEISDKTAENIGIEIGIAGPATISPTLKLPGEIGFDERTIVHVVPRVPGVVTAVYGEYGQLVRKGEVLAVVESPVLADLRSQLLAERKRLGLARITFEREKQLWEEKISAKQDYLAAQQALSEAEINVALASVKLSNLGVRQGSLQQGNLARYEIHAPNFGLITARAIAQGQVLKEDTEIYTVADISTVWAQVTVYAKDLEVLKLGQKATIKATAIDAEDEGTISYISALMGMQTRSATARIVLDNKGGLWRPGMFFTAELVIEKIQVPVAVPTNAIQTLEDHSVIFVRHDQYFEARPLKLGRSDGRVVEVLSGLTAGEKYAMGNSFAIKAELGKAGASHEH